MARIVAILNPKAGSADEAEELRRHAAARGDVRLVETSGPEEFSARVREEAQSCGVLVVVGGDGSVNLAANQLMEMQSPPPLGVVPMGTGNDFCRTLAVPDDPIAALDLVDRGREMALDLIRIQAPESCQYAVNVCAGGFSGQMHEQLTDELKQRWGPLAYIRGAANVLPNLTEYEFYVTFSGGEPERWEIMNLIVANGRYAAAGIPVAPQANPCDGRLDVIGIERATIPEFMSLAGHMLAGQYQDDDPVKVTRTQWLEIEARPGMWFSIDGDLQRFEQVRFEVVPGALRWLTGPGFLFFPQRA